MDTEFIRIAVFRLEHCSKWLLESEQVRSRALLRRLSLLSRAYPYTLRSAGIVLAAALVGSGCAESFHVKSYPGGSKAYIDGQLVGTTPTCAEIPRTQIGLPHTWRVEFRNCDAAEGQLQTGVAGGRIVGYIFTAGILAAFKGPRYYHDVDAVLTGGDCEGTAHTQPVAPAPQPGIMIQNIVGDRNQAATTTGPEFDKTQRLNQRLTRCVPIQPQADFSSSRES